MQRGLLPRAVRPRAAVISTASPTRPPCEVLRPSRPTAAQAAAKRRLIWSTPRPMTGSAGSRSRRGCGSTGSRRRRVLASGARRPTPLPPVPARPAPPSAALPRPDSMPSAARCTTRAPPAGRTDYRGEPQAAASSADTRVRRPRPRRRVHGLDVDDAGLPPRRRRSILGNTHSGGTR